MAFTCRSQPRCAYARARSTVRPGSRPRARDARARAQAGGLELLGEPLREAQRAVERQLHQGRREVAERVPAEILVEESRRGRHLPAEPQVEADRGRAWRHAGVGGAHGGLALLGELEVRPDVGVAKRNARAPGRRLAAELEALLLGAHPVVARRDHVRVQIPEHA